MAPMPAKVSCDSESCPPSPISGTIESPTRASPQTLPAETSPLSDSSGATIAVPATTVAARPSAPAQLGFTAISRVRTTEPEPAGGQDQQHDEQHDGGDGVHQAPDVRLDVDGEVGQVADAVVVGEAEDDRAEERQREAAQAPEDRRAVGVDDQQGQRHGGERERGRDQDPRQRREREPECPGEHGAALGAGAVQGGERLVVDGGAHGHAGPCPVEQQAQPDGHERRGRQGHELVPGDQDPAELHDVALEELAQRSGLAAGPRRRRRCRAVRAGARCVTTSRVVSEVPWRRRMIARSHAAPESGPATSRTTARATGVGHPQS